MRHAPSSYAPRGLPAPASARLMSLIVHPNNKRIDRFLQPDSAVSNSVHLPQACLRLLLELPLSLQLRLRPGLCTLGRMPTLLHIRIGLTGLVVVVQQLRWQEIAQPVLLVLSIRACS